MPAVFPFRAVQYAQALTDRPADVSALVAPPYDVLDAQGKAALLARSDRNIVAIDLPHLPAKELGPPAAYDGAAAKLAQWTRDGTLGRRATPAMFVYRETFDFAGARHQRTGMACTIETLPFGPRPATAAGGGGGVLPHEETFSGPKEDRMALMKATGTQLSPIFGLHADASGRAATLLAALTAAQPPTVTARTPDGTLHELWTIADRPSLDAYAHALAGEDVFIADGHHRYTTGLNYLRGLEAAGPVGPDHPARRCMFVLISMADPGLVIGPTHRVLGGMSGYSFDAFARAAADHLAFEPVPGGLRPLGEALERSTHLGPQRLAVYDFAQQRGALVTPRSADPLAAQFPAKPRAWRTLDVALVQYLIVERIAQPALNAGQPVSWAFPHSLDEVAQIGAGVEKGSGGGKGFVPQLAVIVKPTPLEAVREVSRAGELMPQKSTFFYPKLATGLFMNPLA